MHRPISSEIVTFISARHRDLRRQAAPTDFTRNRDKTQSFSPIFAFFKQFQLFSTIFGLLDAVLNIETRSRALSYALLPHYTSLNFILRPRAHHPFPTLLFYPAHPFFTTLHHSQSPGRISERSDTFYTSIERSTTALHVPKLVYAFPSVTAHFHPMSNHYDTTSYDTLPGEELTHNIRLFKKKKSYDG